MPGAFWYLWAGTVVNRLGGFVVPFLMLYFTTRIGLPPANAALLVSILGAGSFVAQLFGGELADRLGRRPVMMLSFFVTPIAMVFVGAVHDPVLLVPAMIVLGLFTNLYRPAVSAAVADLVPPEKRTRAFGYIYWAINLGAAIAPIVAGFLANFDYFLLFVGDAITTAVFGAIVLWRVPETQSAEHAAAAKAPSGNRLRQALSDPMLLFFTLLTLGFGVIYSQADVTLPLDMAARGLLPSDYGLALAINGALIVLVTIQITRRAERWPRYLVMATAALLVGTGFGLTGLAGIMPTLGFYGLTVVVWTIGEVIGAAVAPSVVSDMSPVGLRGLYQGVWGSAWGLSFFIGPALGGFLFGHYGPGVLWAGAFVLGLILCVGYLVLSGPARRRQQLVQTAQPSSL